LIVNLISAKWATKLIVIYSKIPLHFSNKYGIFCEGELRQHVDTNDDGIMAQQLTQIFDNNSNAAISQQLVGLGQTGLVGLVGRNSFVDHVGLFGHICLVGHINLVNHIGLFGHIDLVGCIGHNSLVGFIGLGLVGFIGLSLVSFVGLCINGFIGLGLVGFIGLGLGSLVKGISLIRLVGLIGFIGLVGLVSFGLNGLIGKGIIVNSLQFKIEMEQSQHDLFLEGELVVVCEESIFFSRWTRLSLWECITKCNTIIF
jgi:hypothetical protein